MDETVYKLRNYWYENPGRCLSECYNGTKYLNFS